MSTNKKQLSLPYVKNTRFCCEITNKFINDGDDVFEELADVVDDEPKSSEIKRFHSRKSQEQYHFDLFAFWWMS